MKLSEALEYQERIKRITAELNIAIRGAIINGMFVDVDVVECPTLSTNCSTPRIETTIKVNPLDID